MSHYKVSTTPFTHDIARGNVAGHKALNKFGANDNVGGTEETIWTPGALYVYLSSAEQLKIASDDAGGDDQGSVLVTGTIDDGTKLVIHDYDADYTGAGVAAGDLFINDTNSEHSIISSVTDASHLVLERATDTVNGAGDSYRIVNANDTGAAVIKVLGLDANYDELSEYIVMPAASGTATTVGSYLRVFRSYVILAGSTGTNEGNITIKNNAATVTQAQIDAGRGQTLLAFWTVPANKRFILTDLWASEVAGKKATVRLYARSSGEAFELKMDFGVVSGSFQKLYQLPLVFLEKTDLEMRAVSAAVGADVSAGFSGYYE